MARPNRDDDLARIYETAQTIAVIGAHPDPQKPAHYVPKYLQEQGFEVIPVNPGYLDREIFGRTPVASVTDIETGVDVVEIFRRSEKVREHVEPILAMDPKPKVVWMQRGIRDQAAAAAFEDAGIAVVQDRCMMQTHKALGLETHGGKDARVGS